LSEHGVQTEEWGGDTQAVKVSALKKIGINELLDAILLQAEILELKTSYNVPADGVVVEAHLDTGRGPVATVMVQNGTLRVGDFILMGNQMGKVRALYDHNGDPMETAGPSTPAQVLGLSGVPLAGDKMTVVADERTAREAIAWHAQEKVNEVVQAGAQSLEQLLGKMKAAETPELAIILKADAQGSVEAIADALTKLNSERVRNKIIHKAAGGVSESDLALAAASGAAIIGFNVRAARGLEDEADKRGVYFKYFSIIYELVDSVKALMEGKLPPILEEVVVGRAEVRQPINVPKLGTIAGSAVVDGKITRNAHLRLIRDEIVIYNGKIGSLRRFKDDVKEVKSGYECGIGFENYNDIKIGDVIEAYEIKETRPTL
jgi:translation initiation factor IF-2